MLATEGGSTGIKRYTLTDQIVEWLSERIISGEFPPSSPLNEVELAETLGCSRSPLREALRVLAQEGLVELVPGKGATVSPLDPEVAAEFYDTRALLESAAARMAVPVLTSQELSNLKRNLEALVKAAEGGDILAYQDLNWGFHTELYNHCANRTLIDLVRLIWRRSLRYGYLLRNDPKRIMTSVKRKRKLLRLLEARDVDGVGEAVRAIVMSGKDDVLEALTQGADDPYSYWARQRELVR